MRRNKGLKPGKGLSKRSSLNSNSRLRSDKELKRGKRLPQRSEKTKEVYIDRRDIVRRLLSERPNCEACQAFAIYDKRWCNPRGSVDIHEILSRARGGSVLEEENLLAVCRPCHQRITENPELSEYLGLAVSSRLDVKESLRAAKIRRQEFVARGGD